MMVDYQIVCEPISDGVIGDVAGVFSACFGRAPDEDFGGRIREKFRPMVVLAYEGGELAGYKLGYERSRGVFYSWLGGVAPAYRRRGLARELLRRQHAWCAAKGYRRVMTESMNRWREMLILNLTEGFDVTGVHLDDDGELHIVLVKALGL